jgi:hypothetical protein
MKRHSPDEKCAIGTPARVNHLQSLSPQLMGKLERQKQMRHNISSPSNDIECRSCETGRKSNRCSQPENSPSQKDIVPSQNLASYMPKCGTPDICKEGRAQSNDQNETPSRNLDLQMLCQKWFQVSVSVVNDLVEMPCIIERIAIFKRRLPSEEERLFSNIGLFLKLCDIDFELVRWDENSQEFGHRDFSQDTASRARMLGNYNEMRDIATSMFGLISDIEGIPVKNIYPRYNVAEDD